MTRSWLTGAALALLTVLPVPAQLPPLSAVFESYQTFVEGDRVETEILHASLAVQDPGFAIIATNGWRTPDDRSGAPNLTSFVTKLTADGTSAVFVSRFDYTTANAVAVNSQGTIAIAGTAYEGFLPTTGAVAADRCSGFAAMIDTAGNTKWMACLTAVPNAVAVDQFGSVYVAGEASAFFRPTVGAFQTDPGRSHCGRFVPVPCPNAFVAKIHNDGSRMLYATFLGGLLEDTATALAVDSEGEAHVVGETVSLDFPTTRDAVQPQYGGGSSLGPLRFGDAFYAKLSADGRSLIYSTYLGGSGFDGPTGIALASGGDSIVAGMTNSQDFPTTRGAAQTSYAGPLSQTPFRGGDLFITRFAPEGAVRYSTLLGDEGVQLSGGVAVDQTGRAFIGASPDFFAVGPSALSAFVGVISSAGDRIDRRVALRGIFDLRLRVAVAVDSDGSLYAAGSARNKRPDPFVATPGAFRNDGSFVASKLDLTRSLQPGADCLMNAASLAKGNRTGGSDAAVAPGEIITLLGTGIGPAMGTPLQLDALGRVSSTLAGIRVSIGGVPAPLLFASDRQINLVAPWGLTGPDAALVIERDNIELASYTVEVTPTVPGIFTINGTGQGQAAAINQDGTLNSAANPARRGSIVSIYATGTGRLNPLPADGELAPLRPPWPSPESEMQMFIATRSESGAAGMEILYAGPAPGFVQGLIQINARIPELAVESDSVLIRLFVPKTGALAPDLVTIAVR